MYTNTIRDKLQHCPFCGCGSSLHIYREESCYITCKNCGLIFKDANLLAQADLKTLSESWNRRAYEGKQSLDFVVLMNENKHQMKINRNQRIIIFALSFIILVCFGMITFSPVPIMAGDVCLSCWGN